MADRTNTTIMISEILSNIIRDIGPFPWATLSWPYNASTSAIMILWDS